MAKKDGQKTAKNKVGEQRKIKRRGQDTLYYVLFGLFALGVGIVLSFTVFFRIDLIKVTENNRFTDAEIIDMSGIKAGENLFRLDTVSIKERLLQAYPYIEDVQIKQMLPTIVEIGLTISEPVAAIDVGTEIFLVNEKGRLLGTKPEGMETGFRYVEGFAEEPTVSDQSQWYRHYTCLGGIEHLGLQDMEEGDLDNGICYAGYQHTSAVSRKSLSPENLEKLEVLLELETLFTQYNIDKITAVELSDVLDIYLLYDNRLQISIGNINELDYKMEFTQYALDNYIYAGATGILDVSEVGTARTRMVNVFADEYWMFSTALREQCIGNIMPYIEPEDSGEEFIPPT